MATLTCRSPLLPVGATVTVHVDGARRDGGPPLAPAIASGTVDAAGLLSITDAAIVSGRTFVLYTLVNSSDHRSLLARSTLDAFDRGDATGTVTLNGTTTLASVVATTGAYAIGQIITGPGIPAGTRLISGSGGNWVMSAAATASGSSVAVVAYGARVPLAVLGSTVVPQIAGTPWQAQVRQRRATAGTL